MRNESGFFSGDAPDFSPDLFRGKSFPGFRDFLRPWSLQAAHLKRVPKKKHWKWDEHQKACHLHRRLITAYIHTHAACIHAHTPFLSPSFMSQQPCYHYTEGSRANVRFKPFSIPTGVLLKHFSEDRVVSSFCLHGLWLVRSVEH